MNTHISTPQDAQLALLRAENTRLKKALMPFASHAHDWDNATNNFSREEALIETTWDGGPQEIPLTFGHLSDARDALDQCM